MRVLITGICGFVGSSLAKNLLERNPALQIFGVDNLLRAGSEMNREVLTKMGVGIFHGDLRMPSDLEHLAEAHWVIDAAAQPSVLAGVDGKSSPRQLSEHNLGGTLNLLEYCRVREAGLILLSTSRVYAIEPLAALPMRVEQNAFQLDDAQSLPPGVSAKGIDVTFSTGSPISLYGATKLASEVMAAEYACTFGFPVWLNRCGVLAGAGQFGTAEQGIFSFWIHSHARRYPLKYIGFHGLGHQVRDVLHPSDLADLLSIQMQRTPGTDRIFNVGGGRESAMSLAQLTAWCDERFEPHAIEPDTKPRKFDIPWFVMNNDRVTAELGWRPKRTMPSILEEIADHARLNPDWLVRCGAR